MNEYILCLDTETTNSFMEENGKLNLDDSMFYDLGLIVGDLNGNIVEMESFVNADIFLNKEIMSSAYFIEKVPMYWEQIKNGTRTLTSFYNIKKRVYELMKKYNITKVYAYNVRFDMNSLGQTTRYLTKSSRRYFFKYGTIPCDIMAYGKQLAKENDYIQFCQENNFLTKNGKPQVKVETIVRYMYDLQFVEDHTGLEDTLHEYNILCTLMQRYPNVDDRLWKD